MNASNILRYSRLGLLKAMRLNFLHFMTRIIVSATSVACVLILFPNQVFSADTFPAEVESIQFGHGTQLTDTQGRSLYNFDNDLREPGTSTCTEDCAEIRPPLLASNKPSTLPENWSLIERNDGTQQWAYKGRPMYRYSKDSHKGAIYGESEGWNAAFETIVTPAEITVASTTLGHVLATQNGQTLYVSNDESGSFECSGNCQEPWLPMKAPWAAIASGNFSVLAREDGVYQWVYQNRPLFQYAGDAERGDLNGNGTDGIWSAMILEPAPPVPEWVTVVGSDGGRLYANAGGMTLYALDEEQNASAFAYEYGSQCDATCLDEFWIPVTAQSTEAPIGDWSVIERESQPLQWAYKGRPLYTLSLETRPGQLYYTTYRKFLWLRPIMYSLPSLQGVF